MGTVQEVELHIRDSEESNFSTTATGLQPLPRGINYRWWLLVSVYTICLLISQSAATLLGRFYFDNGGNSTWLATFVQSGGFPIIIPFLLFFFCSPSTSDISNNTETRALSAPLLALLYLTFGILASGDNLMYSYGLLYLPVSTYSLLCATQLAFNALFSYFLNSFKFTAYIINSIVLLTISASILAFHGHESTDSDDHKKITSGKYIIGFLCTIGASALYSLILSLIQLCFEKVLKKESFWMILEMQIYPALLATSICVGGLFVSGEWRTLNGEMNDFKTGKVSYVMTLGWTTVLWQVFSISCLGLIFEASSLLSNVISTVGLPIVPILAVVMFHDKMDGMKIVAMVLAVWGFISYFYQHYLDDKKAHSTAKTIANDASA